ncbi:hypothetical protein J3R83DRAFT_1093 [Lanmaoa asiatica]|nr:hypothetical protein J3R83DRAFT_1093 [Lanmaoa asiatica]
MGFLAIYFMTYLPALFLSRYLERIGTSRRDPTTGAIIYSGEDLNQSGITEWCFDILYVTWACQIGSGAFGEWFWYFYLLIPSYAAFKIWSNFIGPMIGRSSDKSSEVPPSEKTTLSKRQEKLRKRSEKGDTSQDTPAESFTMDHEHEPGNTALNEELVSDNLNLPLDVHLRPVTDAGDIEAHGGQSAVHPFKVQSHSQAFTSYPRCLRAYMQSDQEPSDTQTERSRIDHEYGCTQLQSGSDQVTRPAISKEAVRQTFVFTSFGNLSPAQPLSEGAAVPAGGSTSSMNINDWEAHAIVHSQEPPLLRARTVSSAAAPGDEREGDHLSCIQMLRTELDHVRSTGLVRLVDEEQTREDFDYPCEDLRSSLPPSSPPQLFSSSPYASSQSSVSGAEPSKKVLAVEVEGRANHDYPHGDHVALVTQDEPCLESKNIHSDDSADVTASPGTDQDCLQMCLTSRVEGGLGPSRKRIANQNDVWSTNQTSGQYYFLCGDKYSMIMQKLDSRLYLPPTPKRATLASQHRQFKKLASPFRPPSKLPIVTVDGLAQTMNNREAESTISATLETSHYKIDLKGPTTPLSPVQHKASNTPRSVIQFKSPLVNRDLPADSRTIRLTPALQALERKLQLLKRAIKVKEENEEEVLARLAGKWIEAGREVAYDVWDATKDARDLEGNATFIRRSCGWENTHDGNTPWGWDTKPGDAGEESRGPDPSVVPCAAGRLAPEEDNDVGCHTLGTMLRQLGIAPEIFGWDDDKEVFSD